MKTVIYGTGAIARIVESLLGDQVCGVVGNSPGSMMNGWRVSDQTMMGELFPPDDVKLLICLGYQHGGMNQKRAELFELAAMAGYKFDKLVPPQMHSNFYVNHGCIILPGVQLHDNVNVGQNCFISSGLRSWPRCGDP